MTRLAFLAPALACTLFIAQTAAAATHDPYVTMYRVSPLDAGYSEIGKKIVAPYIFHINESLLPFALSAGTFRAEYVFDLNSDEDIATYEFRKTTGEVESGTGLFSQGLLESGREPELIDTAYTVINHGEVEATFDGQGRITSAYAYLWGGNFALEHSFNMPGQPDLTRYFGRNFESGNFEFIEYSSDRSDAGIVPLPGSGWLLVAGLAGLGLARRRAASA